MNYAPRITIGSLQSLIAMRDFHRQLGTFTYLCSFVTISVGIYSMKWHSGVWLGELILTITVCALMALALHIVLWMPKKTIRRVDEEVGLADGEEPWPQHT